MAVRKCLIYKDFLDLTLYRYLLLYTHKLSNGAYLTTALGGYIMMVLGSIGTVAILYGIIALFIAVFYLAIIYTHIVENYNFYKWVALIIPFIPLAIGLTNS